MTQDAQKSALPGRTPECAPSGRLAWFTPLPPVRSGIAAYNAELLPELAATYAIDVFVERAAVGPGNEGAPVADVERPRESGAPPTGFDAATPRVRVLDAHEFVWRHAREPYDLVVYQLGNETCHDYMWPYLVRYPGLVVLHDGLLHHARARALHQRRRWDDYRAEFRFSHPDAVAGVEEAGARGLLGPLQYFFPMRRVPVTAALVVAVHSPWLASELAEEFPDARIETVRMGVADPWRFAAAASREAATGRPAATATPWSSAAGSLRARYGIAPDAVLFVVFGRLTPEKRLGPAIRAVAAVAARGLRVHLALVGEPAPYYDIGREIARWGASGITTSAGYASDAEVPAFLAAADVCLCLRWPSARETSASWLRCLAAGKPTIVTDLAHTVDVPALDPRDWSVLPAATPPAGWGPVGSPAAVKVGRYGSKTALHPDAYHHPDPALVRSGSGRSLDRPSSAGPSSAGPSSAGPSSAGPSPHWPSDNATDALEPVCVAIDILDEDHSLALAVDRLARDGLLRTRLGAAARAHFERHHTLSHMAHDYLRVIEVARTLRDRRPLATPADWPSHLFDDAGGHARALAKEIGAVVDFLDA